MSKSYKLGKTYEFSCSVSFSAVEIEALDAFVDEKNALLRKEPKVNGRSQRTNKHQVMRAGIFKFIGLKGIKNGTD